MWRAPAVTVEQSEQANAIAKPRMNGEIQTQGLPFLERVVNHF